jgi:hypothetical protein
MSKRTIEMELPEFDTNAIDDRQRDALIAEINRIGLEAINELWVEIRLQVLVLIEHRVPRSQIRRTLKDDPLEPKDLSSLSTIDRNNASIVMWAMRDQAVELFAPLVEGEDKPE